MPNTARLPRQGAGAVCFRVAPEGTKRRWFPSRTGALILEHQLEGGYAVPSENDYAADREEILSHRYDNGGDYWATPAKRL